MKAYVTETDAQRTWILVIAATISILIMLASGIDNILDFPMFLLLWATVAVTAAAAGHIVWLIVSCFNRKNRFYSVMILTSALLTGISLIWSGIERHRGGFLSGLGAAIVLFFFTIPLAATMLFWIIAGVRDLIRTNRSLIKERNEQ